MQYGIFWGFLYGTGWSRQLVLLDIYIYKILCHAIISIIHPPKHDTENVSNEKIQADEKWEAFSVAGPVNVQVLWNEWKNSTKKHSTLGKDADDIKKRQAHDF